MVITVYFTIQDANNNLNKYTLLNWLFRGNIEKHLRETEKPLNSFPGSPFFPALSLFSTTRKVKERTWEQSRLGM